jgi:hypothetical protein
MLLLLEGSSRFMTLQKHESKNGLILVSERPNVHARALREDG